MKINQLSHPIMASETNHVGWCQSISIKWNKKNHHQTLVWWKVRRWSPVRDRLNLDQCQSFTKKMRQVTLQGTAYQEMCGLSWLTKYLKQKKLFNAQSKTSMSVKMMTWKLKPLTKRTKIWHENVAMSSSCQRLDDLEFRLYNPLTVHSRWRRWCQKAHHSKKSFLIDWFSVCASHFFEHFIVSINAPFYHRTIVYLIFVFIVKSKWKALRAAWLLFRPHSVSL